MKLDTRKLCSYPVSQRLRRLKREVQSECDACGGGVSGDVDSRGRELIEAEAARGKVLDDFALTSLSNPFL